MGRKKLHGMSNTKTHRAWADARSRCTNRNHVHYRLYGERGIAMCQRWLDSFVAFLDDMGLAPEGLVLDRIDNNKGYFPKNCRWTTKLVSLRNKSDTWKIRHNGDTLSAQEYAKITGCSYATLNKRLLEMGIDGKTVNSEDIDVEPRKPGSPAKYRIAQNGTIMTTREYAKLSDRGHTTVYKLVVLIADEAGYALASDIERTIGPRRPKGRAKRPRKATTTQEKQE